MPFLKRHLASILAIFILTLLMVLPFNGIEGRVDDLFPKGFRADYLVHAGIFFAWGVLWWWKEYPIRNRQRNFTLRFLVIGVLLAAGLEIIQTGIPWRTFNILDLASNCAGVIVCLPVGWLGVTRDEKRDT